MWAKIWLVWVIAVFASFGILEGLSAAASYKDTLSDTTWKFLNIIPGQPLDQWTLPHVLAVIALLAIAIVLVLHLGLGLFR